MWLERIRHGVLQINADGSEACYFRPGMWQKLYLAWVFRNFRTLPEPVLNDRQRKIIGQICQAEKRMPAVRRARPLLIGRVDCAPARLKKSSQDHLDSSLGLVFHTQRLEATVDATSRSRLSVAVADPVISAGALAPPLQISSGLFPDGQSSAGGQPGGESAPPKVARDYMVRATAAVRMIHAAAGALQLSTGKIWLAAACAVLLIVGATCLQLAYLRTPAAVIAVSRADAAALGKHAVSVAASATTFEEFRGTAPATKRTASFAAPPRSELNTKRPAPVPELLAEIEPSQADLRLRKIVYPDTFSAAEGHVLLKLMVDPAGNVSDVQVLNGDRNLVKAAVAAVKRWKYEPRHTMNGAISTTARIHFMGSDAVTVQFPNRTAR